MAYRIKMNWGGYHTLVWLPMMFATPTVAQQSPMLPLPPPAVQISDDGAGVPLLISVDRDLVAKPGTAMDSWFVISHLKSGMRTLDLLVHYIRLTPPQGAPFIQAIASATDPAGGKYVGEEKAYTLAQTTWATDKLDVRNPSGTITGDRSAMHVTANFSRLKIDMTLADRGPPLANVGNGLLPFYGDINYEYALPGMTTTGTVTIDGERYEATGVSWFDRQWGQMAPRFWGGFQWSWMGISLNEGVRISLWDIIDQGHDRAFATVLHPDGRQELVDVEPLAKGTSEMWTSSTGNRYPTRWRVSIPSLGAHFDVRPLLREQEVVSPIKAHKYEGASTVVGTMSGKTVAGHAVVELVGNWK